MQLKQGFLILVLILVACVPPATAPVPIAESTSPLIVTTAVPPTPTSVPPTPELTLMATVVSTATTQLLAATATTEATAVPPSETPTSTPLITVGRTAEGLYFQGNPEAPITMIDYSDFL